ncbi:hypothetical protein [Psittacicella gerlachiana]|uniref:Calcineurin-like phosphoesterase domain-containing protein n=1 Tax=Psittacicella gerlachiana TaxID=2028574 RepID=A0A3A1YLG3_9GAMM|nr:hypothetical protein [Psittacicella gerlachiana]RIY38505.1 hypothetical protein CKF59_00785 [Psittacicella gerlachiana]
MTNKLPFTTQVSSDQANLSVYNFFISDLHLAPQAEELLAKFSNFCQELATFARESSPQHQRHLRLYILGDFLALGIGDFVPEWFIPYQKQLLALQQQGVEIFFMGGNRDFLLKKKFAQSFGATYLPENTLVDFSANAQGAQASYSLLNLEFSKIDASEPHYQTNQELRQELQTRLSLASDFYKLNPQASKPLASLRLCLCHGDNLCLGDQAYQKYRRFIRSTLMQVVEKLIPTFVVKAIAKKISQKSKAKRQEQEQILQRQAEIDATWGQATKLDLADIELNYTSYLGQVSQANLMVYGHIHRQRFLGWQQDTVTAYGQQFIPITFGNLDSTSTQTSEVFCEVDHLYPLPVGKIRTFTGNQALQTLSWEALDQLTNQGFKLNPEDPNFYAASMADWLSTADLTQQQEHERSQVQLWQAQIPQAQAKAQLQPEKENERQRLAWATELCQQPQTSTSVGLLVQHARKNGQTCQEFSFTFIELP